MNNPQLQYFRGQNPPVLIGLENCTHFDVAISTKTSNSILITRDRKFETFYPNSADFTGSGVIADFAKMQFDPPYTGDLKLYMYAGKKDIYSVFFRSRGLKITFEEFFPQVKNLYSIGFGRYDYGNTYDMFITGNLPKSLPDSVERVKITDGDFNGSSCGSIDNTIQFNFNDFSPTSKLKFFSSKSGTGWDWGSYYFFGKYFNVYGDLSRAPIGLEYCDIACSSNSLITYTKGRKWVENFNSLILATYSFSSETVDNILIDLAASVKTAFGDKLIWLKGGRTAASDAAVAYLQGLGFTVTIN